MAVTVFGKQFRDNPLELAAVFAAARAVSPGKGDVLFAGAPQPERLQFGIQFLPGHLQHRTALEIPDPFHRVGHPLIDVPFPASQGAPLADQFDATLLKVQRTVGDQQVGIETEKLAQPITFKTHSLGAVEAEKLRCERFEAGLAVRASVTRGKRKVAGDGRAFDASPRGLPARTCRGCRVAAPGAAIGTGLGPLGRLAIGVLHADDQVPLPNPQSIFNRFGKPRANAGTSHQPVDDHFNVVTHLPIQAEVVCQRDDRAVDAGADKTLFQQGRKQVAVLTLLTPDHRGQHAKPRASGQAHDAANDLFAGLSRDRTIALGAVTLSHAGVEHSQVIVNLRDRAHGRPRITPGGFLRNGDGGAEPLDQVHLGLWHLAEELPSEAAETFHVAALTFGIDGVESQRAFPRSRNASQANQLVPRQDNIDVAKIVLTSTFDNQIRGGHVQVGGSTVYKRRVAGGLSTQIRQLATTSADGSQRAKGSSAPWRVGGQRPAANSTGGNRAL